MPQSVYIETSVPSYYFETRTAPQARTWRAATRDWWDNHRERYDLVTSRFVMLEVQRAPEAKAADMIRLLARVPVVEEPQETEAVAEYYIEQGAMPRSVGGDAYHLALASLARTDFLLTWNCRHLANANKQRHLAVLNGRLGLPMPIITTPMTLMPEDAP